LPPDCVLPVRPFRIKGGRTHPGIHQLQPEVAPQVLHFMQVPLRTNV
jgi:hypothetical protein